MKDRYDEIIKKAENLNSDFFNSGNGEQQFNSEWLKSPDPHWAGAWNFTSLYRKKVLDTWKEKNYTPKEQEKDFPLFVVSAAYVGQLGPQLSLIAPYFKFTSLKEIANEFTSDKHKNDVVLPTPFPPEVRLDAAKKVKTYIEKLIVSVVERNNKSARDFLNDKLSDYLESVSLLGQLSSGEALVRRVMPK